MGVVLPNKRGTIQIIILYLLLFSLSFSVRHVPGIVPGVPFPYIPEESVILWPLLLLSRL